MRGICEQVNARERRVTRRPPDQMLEHERARLHQLPAGPHTVAFGPTRTVPASMPMVAFEGGQYSVPAELLGQVMWVRVHGQGWGKQVIIVHVRPAGPVEVARHARATPGSTCSRLACAANADLGDLGPGDTPAGGLVEHGVGVLDRG